MEDLLYDLAEFLSPEDCFHLSLTNRRITNLIYRISHIRIFNTFDLLKYKNLTGLSIDFVDLSNMERIINPPSVPYLKFLSNLEYLYLRAFNSGDISTLVNLRELHIWGSSSIKDISCLTNLKKLSLGPSVPITDLSRLIHLEELELSNRRITKLSPLINLRSLTLTNNQCVSDLFHLTNLTKLNLSQCENIETLPSLPSLRKLNISGNSMVHNVSHLTGLTRLIINRRMHIEKLFGLFYPLTPNISIIDMV